ncbi:MAG: penicillin-binding protein 2 [Oscillospiraceae bacterium]|nr:penicillin-binding protein 2 [Oscillospiraceae bacterium]
MKINASKNRIVLIFIAFSVIFLGLTGRIAALSGSADLLEAANRQRRYSLKAGNARGIIYDRNFNRLTDTQEVYRAVIFPESSAETINDTIRKITALSTLSATDVQALYNSRKPFFADVPDPFTHIAKINEIPGGFIFKSFTRYSDNQAAAHIIGHLNPEENEGVSGIEKACDEFLSKRANNNSISFLQDGAGYFIKGRGADISDTRMDTGGVVLTIDKGIQAITERIGNERIKKGAIVISDPYNGDILASASFPGINPNNLADSVNDTQNSPMINRAFYSYNVGSTFKIAVTAAALESGISTGFSYKCKGKIEIQDQTFRCHERSGHGVLDMNSALTKSCNTYYIYLASKMKVSVLRQKAYDLGYGKPIGFYNGYRSSGGYLPSEADLNIPGELANFSFGQGKFLANPVQINAALSAILNDGKYLAPRLIRGFTSDGSRIESESENAPIPAVNPSSALKVKEFLIEAMSERADNEDGPKTVTVGGKTGTAQTGRKNSAGKEEYSAWFCGFFPAHKPLYVVTVLIEDGESGNRFAFPVFSLLADEITNYNIYANLPADGSR